MESIKASSNFVSMVKRSNSQVEKLMRKVDLKVPLHYVVLELRELEVLPDLQHLDVALINLLWNDYDKLSSRNSKLPP